MILFPSAPHFSFTESQQLPYQSYENDVVSVLDSVVLLFRQYFDNVDAHPLKVVNIRKSSDDCPMTLYEKSSILLCVDSIDDNGKPALFWSQYIYQFTHEFCHYMNFGHVVPSIRWFEECLCELASHFFMIKSAEHWAVFPPYPHWASYAPNILSYELDNRNDIYRIDITELAKPKSKLLIFLEKNEYQRKINRYIALKLLPYFIKDPSLWNIVPYLTSLTTEKSFIDNLRILQDLSGTDTSKLLNIFGINQG